MLDLSQRQIDGWNSSELPIYEPGLDEVGCLSPRRGCCIWIGHCNCRSGSWEPRRCPSLLKSALEVLHAETRPCCWARSLLCPPPRAAALRWCAVTPRREQVVVRTRGKNLFFSTNVDKEIEDADVIFISVNTPTKLHGIGAGRAANIKNCELAARNIAKVRQRSPREGSAREPCACSSCCFGMQPGTCRRLYAPPLSARDEMPESVTVAPPCLPPSSKFALVMRHDE